MSSDLDPDLWVPLRGRWAPDADLRWLIAGNAHTHRGHFSVVAPRIDQYRTVNRGDVAEHDHHTDEDVAPALAELPPADPVFSTLGRPPPWVVVGGLFRLWDGGQWVAANPQPGDDPLQAWAWPGSVCEHRRHCDMTVIADRYFVCDDCHGVGGQVAG